jgi:hypothetical protein
MRSLLWAVAKPDARTRGLNEEAEARQNRSEGTMRRPARWCSSRRRLKPVTRYSRPARAPTDFGWRRREPTLAIHAPVDAIANRRAGKCRSGGQAAVRTGSRVDRRRLTRSLRSAIRPMPCSTRSSAAFFLYVGPVLPALLLLALLAEESERAACETSDMATTSKPPVQSAPTPVTGAQNRPAAPVAAPTRPLLPTSSPLARPSLHPPVRTEAGNVSHDVALP